MRQDRLQNLIGTIRDKRKRMDPCGGGPSIRIWSQCFFGVGKMQLSYLIQRLFSMA